MVRGFSLKKIVLTILVLISTGTIVVLFFWWVGKLMRGPTTPPSEEEPPEETTFPSEEGDGVDFESFYQMDRSYFGFVHPNKTYSFAKELGVHWEINPTAPFIWGKIEKSAGDYDWEAIDGYVKKAQSYDVALIATIWPFADWDQESCHDELPHHSNPNRPDLGEYRQIPCDMDAYSHFVMTLVERYDGDGEDGVEGLKYPIRYWEVMDEPEEGEDMRSLNFKGENQAEDYLEILKVTAQAVKSADPQSKVLNGGIAGLGQKEVAFWESVFRSVGRDYVDIITIHAVNSSENLQIDSLKSFMVKYTLTQPIWVTEVQFKLSTAALLEELEPKDQIISEANARDILPLVTQKDKSEEEWAEYLVKVYVQAFANGARKLFYGDLSNTTPTQDLKSLVYCKDSEENLEDNFIEIDPQKCSKQKSFYAFSTLVSKIDYFEEVEELGAGQYKFNLRKKVIYILWGNRTLPKDVKGSIRVTDIYGESVDIQAENLFLTDEPVYIEVL